MMAGSEFWLALDHLVATSNLLVDRPRGSPHPRYPAFRYPLDYGYLQGTCSPDRAGIDVWIGSLPRAAATAGGLSPAGRTVTGVIATVDLDKRDAEFKLLLGCTAEEAQLALAIHNRGSQAGILIERRSTGGGNNP